MNLFKIYENIETYMRGSCYLELTNPLRYQLLWGLSSSSLASNWVDLNYIQLTIMCVADRNQSYVT